MIDFISENGSKSTVFLTCCRSLDEVEEVVCREIPHRVPTPYSQISVDERQGLNRDWSPRFSTLWDKHGWIRTTAFRSLNVGVS